MGLLLWTLNLGSPPVTVSVAGVGATGAPGGDRTAVQIPLAAVAAAGSSGDTGTRTVVGVGGVGATGAGADAGLHGVAPAVAASALAAVGGVRTAVTVSAAGVSAAGATGATASPIAVAAAAPGARGTAGEILATYGTTVMVAGVGATGSAGAVDVPPALSGPSLGRFQVGQVVRLSVGLAAPPDAAPTVIVRGPDGTIVVSLTAFMRGSSLQFGYDYFVGPASDVGEYSVTFSYRIDGAPTADPSTFEVIPGGDQGGAIVSMFSYLRPEAQYVVVQLACGALLYGKNPSLTSVLDD